MQPIAEAIDVSKRFASTLALDRANIAVMPGELHALVGRNGAGKSTLVAILTGLLRPDGGRVRLHGDPAPAIGDRHAWAAKVACVYQHSKIVPQLCVAENIFLNRYGQGAFISWPRLRSRARELLAEWNVPIDADAPAHTLSVEERQLIEIVRALSFGARFVILDEPTAHLERRAIERLFVHLRALQRAGVTILFISHHLQEVYDLCDAVTVFRDAQRICTRRVCDLPQQALIEAMTGSVSLSPAQTAHVDSQLRAGEPALEVHSLNAPGIRDLHVTLWPGEIVGLAGTGGSGKTIVAETIAGLHKARSGTLRIDGQPVAPGSVRAALRAGIGMVPRDRHGQGLVLDLSLAENATMTMDDRLGWGGFIAPAARRRAAQSAIARLGIVSAGADRPVRELSGGNQQKVVFARALAREPRVLILMNPTAGIDVKSKEALLREIHRARRRGTAVLIVSDDLDDLRACDRVVVLVEGCVRADIPAGWNDNALIAQIEGVAAHA